MMFFASKTGFKITKALTKNLCFIQKANITGRGTRGGPLELLKPFPYEDRPFTLFDSFFDNTMYRVCQENAKIIVIEGPIACGKSAFAQELAEQLDMKYIPQPTMDDYYILYSGYDLRQHDDELPSIVRSFDHRKFCVNPTDPKSCIYQINMMFLRFFQYVDALAHLLNTGQGVILERSFYSDYVFARAMFENKYISKEGNKKFI